MLLYITEYVMKKFQTRSVTFTIIIIIAYILLEK